MDTYKIDPWDNFLTITNEKGEKWHKDLLEIAAEFYPRNKKLFNIEIEAKKWSDLHELNYEQFLKFINSPLIKNTSRIKAHRRMDEIEHNIKMFKQHEITLKE